MAKRALITGITGQDGMYLSEFLLDKGYQVFSLIRGQQNPKKEVIEKLVPKVELVEGDLTDTSSLIGALEYCQPDEVYNLGAISFVALSFKQPELTGNITGLGALRLLEAIRIVDKAKKIRFYQASSSEMFGKVRETPQTEMTPFHPRSPYGVAKVYAHFITLNYRESYDMFACSGILFNHESPRRGENFVTRKITRGIASIIAKKEDKLYLGNLDAKRDWGFAKEYVQAMWLMLQQDKPDDYVIATGETHTVREFLELAFELVGLNWKSFVKIDPQYFRPTEVDILLGDASKARKKLGWEPKVKFKELVVIMLNADLKNAGLDLRVGKKSIETDIKEESIVAL